MQLSKSRSLVQTRQPLAGLNPAPRPTCTANAKPLSVAGNFLFCGDEKFFIKGVSYRTFVPNAQGEPFPTRQMVAKDFALMRAAGFNALRTYDVPPGWLLDLAAQFGLRVMVGLPWPQHLASGDSRAGRRQVVQAIESGIKACAHHANVLAYCVGNEIPTQIVRWYGKARTEEFIRTLVDAARQTEPNALLTYANYPPTEYLELPFLDFHCFNVYLHAEKDFQAYLARLQMLVGSKPICLSEYGLDALGHGEAAQAELLVTQTTDIFRAGFCGAIAFSWTDEWYRGGNHIRDWQFGIVSAERKPKRTYRELAQLLPTAPFVDDECPSISVVVAAHNAAHTLGDCLSSLSRLNYPDFEVIVVDDGSKDRTGELADTHARLDQRIKVLHVPNHGLSVARNIGLASASASIVAYTDADCRVDRDWLHYIALELTHSDLAGVGGPNLVPCDDGLIAQAVGLSPGNPTHIMLSDTIAEHIPGCNMAFWKWVLEDVGGFQPVYTSAGDDVDICWRLQAHGYRIGFAPSALVWHHRRNSVRAYLKQQVGYGHAESLLEREHPEKFNGLGQVRWAGRIYAALPSLPFLHRPHIYQGVFGSAYFQSIYRPADGLRAYLPQTPEWYVWQALLLMLSVLNPIFVVLPLAGFCWKLMLCAHAALSAPLSARDRRESRRLRWLIFVMHYLQPLARTWGRLQGGLGPFRWTRAHPPRVVHPIQPWPHAHRLILRDFDFACWGEWAQDKETFLRAAMRPLFNRRCVLDFSSGWEDWDLRIQRGLSASAKLLAAAEYHGGTKVLIRCRVSASPTQTAILTVIALALGAFAAFTQQVVLHTDRTVIYWLALLLPLFALLRLIWQRTQLLLCIDEALRQAADELNMKVMNPKEGRL